jgi:hypothetical protein
MSFEDAVRVEERQWNDHEIPRCLDIVRLSTFLHKRCHSYVHTSSPLSVYVTIGV